MSRATTTPDPHSIVAAADAIYLDACALVKLAKMEGDETNDESRTMSLLLISGEVSPLYTSRVGLGETLGRWGEGDVQREMGLGLYLFVVRTLFLGEKRGKLKLVEPSEDRLTFLKDADRLGRNYGNLGGADLWHLMSAIELNRSAKEICFLSYDRKLVSAAEEEGMTAIDGKTLQPEPLMEAMQAAAKFVIPPHQTKS